MTKDHVRAMLKIYRSTMTPAQRKRTRQRKPRGSSYPIGVERGYARFIREKTRALVNVSLLTLRPLLDNWAVRVHSDARMDSLSDDVDALFASIEAEMLLLYGQSYIASDIGTQFRQILEAIFGKNSKFMQSELQIISGVPFTIDAPWWNEVRSLWESENYQLMKGLGQDYVSKLNSTIISGIQQGLTLDELIAEITKLSDAVTGYRARRIARDQIGKLNSVIARRQFEDIGMTTYYWRTAQDEKVRGNPTGRYSRAIPSHYLMEGLLLAINNAGVYYDESSKSWVPKTAMMEPLHPGMAVMCRCIPIPSWNTYLSNIDEELTV